MKKSEDIYLMNVEIKCLIKYLDILDILEHENELIDQVVGEYLYENKQNNKH